MEFVNYWDDIGAARIGRVIRSYIGSDVSVSVKIVIFVFKERHAML